MQWNLFSPKVIRIEETMKKENYLDVLNKKLKSSEKQLGLGHRLILTQDNDRKRTSLLIQSWLK